ncbi:MAG: metal-dependent transcriptional regulator [Microbacteriaceae bacterium]|nr:metal-dependent transcriptional regulator [Microbacteriaceae bacterium]
MNAPGRTLKAQEENYLKAVWSDEEWGRATTNGTLAAALGLAPSSVTEAVRKLAAAGLLSHARYGVVALTEEGRAIAVGIVRKHRLIETFLVRELGYGWDEVHAEAEVLEHAVSTEFIDRLDARLGRPERDPHGDLIPRADGTIAAEDAVPLGSVLPGARLRIVRVSDAVPGLLARLDDAGLGLGARIVAGEGAFAADGAFSTADLGGILVAPV